MNLSQIGRFFNGPWIFLQCLFSVTIWFVGNLNVFNILIDISVFVMFLQSYFKLFLKCFCYVLFNVLFTCFLDGYSIVSWMVIQLCLGCFFNVFSICFFSVMTWEGTDPNPDVTGPTATLSGLGPFSLWENRSRSRIQTHRPISSRSTPSRYRKKKISSAICEFRL